MALEFFVYINRLTRFEGTRNTPICIRKSKWKIEDFKDKILCGNNHRLLANSDG